MKKLSRHIPFTGRWREISLGLLAAGVASATLSYRLGSLAPQTSPGERASLRATEHISAVFGNLMYAPHKLLLWANHFAPAPHAATAARLPSVLLALITLALMTFILRRWYGRRSMLFGTVLFLTSAWFLHIARFAGFGIDAALGMVILLATHVLLHDYEGNRLVLFAWLLVSLLLLFIPGFAWFVLLGLIWQWRALLNAWQELEPLWARLLWIVTAVTGLLVPVVSIIWTPRLLWPWLGLPDHLVPISTLLTQLRIITLMLVYRGPHDPQLWLGQLPLLDAFVLVMLGIGIYFYARRWQATRTQMLFSYTLLGLVLASLGTVSLEIILPLLYIIAVGGLAYALFFWLHVFPRNPLARGLGIGLVGAVIALACFYNLSQYFVAWPHNPDVVTIYRSGHR